MPTIGMLNWSRQYDFLTLAYLAFNYFQGVMDIEKLIFPIGPFDREADIQFETRKEEYIKDIELLPERMENAVKDLNDELLDTTYRPGGWEIDAG